MDKNKKLLGRPQTKHLKPVRSKQEASKIGKIGGIKSGEIRREQKAMRDALRACLNYKFKSNSDSQIAKWIKENYPDIDMLQAGALAQVYKMTMGDTVAAVFVRDTIGEKPVDRKEIEGNLDVAITAKDIALIDRVFKRIK